MITFTLTKQNQFSSTPISWAFKRDW